MDRSAGEVRKHGLKIKLSGQPLEILLVLLERPGELVTREELQQRLWPQDIYVDFEHSLNTAVKKLRRLLNDDPDDPRYIETQPRKGYRFIGVIEPVPTSSQTDVPTVASESTPQPRGLSDSGQSAEATRNVPVAGWKWAAVLATAAVVTIAVIIVFGTQRTKQPKRPAAASQQVYPRPSIDVLGFQNLSVDRGSDWLSTAFSQMLSTELERGGKVRIIPEEIVARAKRDLGISEKDGYARNTLRSVRTDLGTDYVVAGSYLALGAKDAAQVRLDLRLQETISGETLASIAVSGKQSEIFSLVARAADELRAKVGASIPPEGDVDWRAVLPSNPQAGRLYSDGLGHLRRSENVSASELLQQAVALEPGFALGHAALAESWQALGYNDRALASAQKALSLATTLPEDERLKIEGRYYELQHDWAGAIGAYRHLWQDYPDDIESALRLVEVQTTAGNNNDALSTISTLRSLPAALKNDPRIDLAEAALAARNADYKREQQLAQQAAAKSQQMGARLLLARAKLVEGWALDDQSQLKEALEAYSTAQQIFADAGDLDGVATALNDIGIVLQKQDNLSAAHDKLQRAQEIFRQVGDQNGLGAVLTNLGEVHRAQGRLSDAEGLYRDALAIFRNTGRKDNEYATMNNLGSVLYQRGDFRGARKLFDDLLQARQALGDKNGVALAKTNLADTLRVQGELDRALPLYNEAISAFRQIGDPAMLAAVQVSLAKAEMVQHNLAAARRALEEALVANQQIGAAGDAALVRVLLGELALEEEHPEKFDDSVVNSIEELSSEHRATDEVEARAIQIRAYLNQGKVDEARRTLTRAHAVRTADWLAKFHLELAEAQLKAVAGNRAAAKRQLAAVQAGAERVRCKLCGLEIRSSFRTTTPKAVPVLEGKVVN